MAKMGARRMQSSCEKDHGFHPGPSQNKFLSDFHCVMLPLHCSMHRFCLSTHENIIKTKTTLLWFACCNINQPMTYDNHVTRTIPTHYAVMTSKRFPHYCPFAMGIHSHHKGSVVRCVDVCLIFTRTSHWTNSRVVDEFRRYDARVMSLWRRMKWDICWITVRCFSHHCWIPLTGHYMIPTALNHHGSCWCPSAKWGTRSSATSVFDPLYLILLTPPTLLDRCKVWKITPTVRGLALVDSPTPCWLTHSGLVTPCDDIDLSQECLRLWLNWNLTAPSQYLNRCRFINTGVL